MAVTNYYTIGGGIVGEKAVGGSRVDYLTDALGSVVVTVDQSAQVLNTYRFKPYGDQLSKTGVGADPAFLWVGSKGYRHTGRRYSNIYIRARHYSSEIATWASRDPIWPAAPAYAYACVAPTVCEDSSGLICQRQRSPYDCSQVCSHLVWGPIAGKGDTFGKTVCCEGHAYTCIRPNWGELEKLPGEALDKLKMCLALHEDSHRKDCEGECKKAKKKPPFFCELRDHADSKCKAYQLELTCLKMQRDRCSDEKCREILRIRACDACERAARKCREAKMRVTLPPICKTCKGYPWTGK
jgi:RHS repeat-associated protein